MISPKPIHIIAKRGLFANLLNRDSFSPAERQNEKKTPRSVARRRG